MNDEEVVTRLRKILDAKPTGDALGDWSRLRGKLMQLIKAVEDGRQSVESVREDGSKVFRLD
jgi:hypothetical protein